MSQINIAAAIGVSPSTITRELKRNSGSRRKHNFNTAHSNATYHKHRHPGNHAVKAGIRTEVVSLLVTKQWSPRQISGRLAEADGRRFGNLEKDTIVGKNNKGAIVTIIDRSTDWLFMRKLPHGKDAFADSHALWQKGGIENPNGLIR